MNITPNYQLTTFNYTRLNNQPLQTNPSFGNKTTKLVEPAIAAGIGAIVWGLQNANKSKDNEVKLPTREEFEKTLNEEKIVNIKKYLEAFDKDPKNTIAIYNLADKYGKRIADEISINRLTKIMKHPELIKEIIDTENEFGLQQFSGDDAIYFPDNVTNYPNGLRKMLNMRDEFGGLRFQQRDDYVAAEVFEKYPEEAEKYANMLDEYGNYRFDGNKIDKIVKAKKEGLIKPEDIDNIMNLKRDDGSYVFKELPSCENIKLYIQEPELFKAVCNIKIPSRDKYTQDFYKLPGLLSAYKSYPQETKHLLQIPGKDEFESRFSEKDIIDTMGYAQIIFKNAPKTFMALASLKKDNGYRFDLSDICEIVKSIKGSKLSELSIEDMKVIHELSQIQTTKKHRIDHYNLKTEEICKLFNTYKLYPVETKEIINSYFTRNEDNDEVPLIPTGDDVKLYIENREEFDKKYEKVSY